MRFDVQRPARPRSDYFTNGGTDKARFRERRRAEQASGSRRVRRAASLGRTWKKSDVSEIVKAANVRDAVAGIYYFIENGFAELLTSDADDGKPCSNSRRATMIHVTVQKDASAKVESVKFEIRLCQKIVDIVLSPSYLVKITATVLETYEFLALVAHVVKKETSSILEASSRCEERIK